MLRLGPILVALIALPGFASAADKYTPPASVSRAATSGTANLVARAHYDSRRGAYFAPLPKSSGEAELTLDRSLQPKLEDILRTSRLQAGAIVAMDPRSGRVLGLAETSRTGQNGVAFTPAYPAASVFKIVTAAALLESGVGAEDGACFHGGMHSLDAKNLKDDPRRDRRCASLALAMGKSLNVVFGKLASKELDADRLRTMANRFYFNQPLPLAATATEASLVSPAQIPEDPLGFGRAAAGFGQVFLSPLHGALLASIVANGGLAAPPQLVEATWSKGVRTEATLPQPERVVGEETAATLANMMKLTVSEGTARKAFRVGRRWALGDIPVAGKTGTLADKAPFKDYSWFVGFAPANDPTIAVAVVAVNGPKWTVRAPVVAREALQAHFAAERDRRRASR